MMDACVALRRPAGTFVVHAGRKRRKLQNSRQNLRDSILCSNIFSYSSHHNVSNSRFHLHCVRYVVAVAAEPLIYLAKTDATGVSVTRLLKEE